MNTKIILISSLVSIALTGCGGSSGSGDKVDAETGDLKTSAIGSIGKGFDGSLNAVGRTINQNSGVSNTLTDVTTVGANEMGTDVPTNANVQGEVQNWLSVSLATDENPNSTTNRNGNTITVDPDEAELCREEGVFDDSSAEEISDCTAFFKDVTVSLVATAEEAGVLTYLYQQKPVLSLGYAPNSESVELDFGGVMAVIDGLAVIDPDEFSGTLPSVMSGSIKLAASEINVTEGQEAGTVTYSVVKPIRFVTTDDEGEASLSINPGTLFSISADSATGQGSMSFDLGAIAAAAPTESGLGQMNLAGFTGQANVNPTDGELVVRNFGLSKGPFSLSLNNEEVMSATLGAFGFRVSEGTDLEPGELIIDGNMDLSIMLKQFEGLNLEGDLAVALDMMAPNGTSIERAGNGATKIGGAGPFTISLGRTPAVGNPTVETVRVESGQCFNEVFTDTSVAPSAEQCL